MMDNAYARASDAIAIGVAVELANEYFGFVLRRKRL
jgi:hypothetical protein